MALTHQDTFRVWRIGALRPAAPGPLLSFVRSAGLGAIAVAALAFAVFGAPLAVLGLCLAIYFGAAALAGRACHRSFPHPTLGACNQVTLARLAVVCALVAPAAMGLGAGWGVFALAAAALASDGVDGWLARRYHRVSGFGARFDMEVDSGLALVLAVIASASFGWPALVLGLPRYGFALAGVGRPWMRRDLPPRFSRKAVCVAQLGALIALQAPVLPAALASALAGAVALALLWSFAVDVVWLWRRRG